MDSKIKLYIEGSFETAKAKLFEFLSIPSVSADSAYQKDVQRCANFVADYIRECGFSEVTVTETAGHPVVYAEKMVDPTFPTVMFYGHYDVQPADPFDLWLTPPFQPDVRDGYVFARGAADDKGQVMCHLFALKAYHDTNTALPVNVKILIEGEEEITSPNLEPYLVAHREQLFSDVIVISDNPMLGPDQPSICTSLRGILYTELTVIGTDSDLHSGQKGGPAPNAIHAISTVISRLKDSKNRVTIPGFYDAVRVLPSDEAETIRRVSPDEKLLMKQIGANVLTGENGFSIGEQLWYRPTLDVNGIWGGYTGEGSKTVIAAKAYAKISMRLVNDQDPDDIFTKFKSYLSQIVPQGFQYSLHQYPVGRPFRMDSDHVGIQAAKVAVTQAFGAEPVLVGEGGSIPIVAAFQDVLDASVVLMGFNLPDDYIHAPNERFRLDRFQKGCLATAIFLEEFSKVAKG